MGVQYLVEKDALAFNKKVEKDCGAGERNQKEGNDGGGVTGLLTRRDGGVGCCRNSRSGRNKAGRRGGDTRRGRRYRRG